MGEAFDFAFLDIDRNGRQELRNRRNFCSMPGFRSVFVSGSRRSLVPPRLKGAPFVAKPFSGRSLLDALKADRPSLDIAAHAC